MAIAIGDLTSGKAHYIRNCPDAVFAAVVVAAAAAGAAARVPAAGQQQVDLDQTERCGFQAGAETFGGREKGRNFDDDPGAFGITRLFG